MKLPPFEYACPTTLTEAVALLASHNGEAKALAGGQSLMPMMAFRIAQPSLLVDLRKLPDLREIKIGADGVRLGAHGALARHPGRRAARDARIRCSRPRSRMSRTTRSAIAAPSAAASRMPIRPPRCPASRVTCDAEIAVIGKAGARTIKAADFFHGALTTALKPDEIITEVRLPAWPARRRCGFQEFARRRGDFAMAGIALFYDPDAAGKASNAHIGVIGVGDRPQRLAGGGSRAQRPASSTRRPSRRSAKPPRPPRSIRRTTSTPAPPIAARWPAHGRARAQRARRLEMSPHAGPLRSQRQAGRVEVEPRLTLADCLRHELRLTGTHVGCEHGVCGACTVLVDGDAVRSCLMLAVQAEGAKVVTVEGLSNDADLTPLQKSFRKHHALQCGFCTPGFITTAHALLERGAGLRRRPRARGALRQHLPLHRLYRHRRGGARRARRLQEVEAAAHEEHLHRHARWSGARICASCAAAANMSTISRPEACSMP